ncbi:MAG: type IV toxin-antitoxin system AbiEi family antitoxin domain-containing protein [Candidatus Riflebacteria bacterium]|nr:type IV toxin-antitoxin system AbiEi family antitoxin domain-containing protein [Candidatus Riflebacteria bacterium]
MTRLPPHENCLDKAQRLIKKQGGIIRTADAIRAGIHPRTLYNLRNNGTIEQLSRGVFRLADHTPVSNPDLVVVALRIPNGIICLVSALAFHGITTQIPHAVSIAQAKGSELPRLAFPPLIVHRFSGPSLNSGIEIHFIDGVPVKIFSPEKTLADCFKFRNKIGLDIFLEALRFLKNRNKLNISQLLKFAAICRVERAMRPYLEATV